MTNLDRVAQYLAYAEADLRSATTHSGTVHAMNRVAKWRREVKRLAMANND